MVSFATRRFAEGVRVVLVIEDDADVGAALQSFISDHGFVVLVEGDAENALHTLERIRPHVVLFDHRMPGLDVVELARRVRSSEDAFGAPRLLMTCTGPSPALAVHVDAVLQKPFDTDRLVELLHQHAQTARRGAMRALSAAEP